MGLANAYVAIANDPWAAFYNPAGLAHVSSIQASAFCSPAQFGMDELRTMSIGATLPLSILTGSIAIDQFGYDLYRETSVALAFGASANEWISLGLTTHFTRLAIRGYGTTSQMVFDVGGIATVFDGVSMGWCWKNFTRTSVGAQSGQIPQILSMGACYEITEDSRLVVELEKELHYPIVRKFGYEQRLLAFLSVRLGISDNPDKFSCGLGLSAAGFEFSYAGYSHPQLGWTHQVEISVSLSQKPEAE
jgi:opacity protein-like surface antigen